MTKKIVAKGRIGMIKGKRISPTHHESTFPSNPNKQNTKISAKKSISHLKEENRAVIYGYRN